MSLFRLLERHTLEGSTAPSRWWTPWRWLREFRHRREIAFLQQQAKDLVRN